MVPVVDVEYPNGKGRAKSILIGELASSVPQIVRKTTTWLLTTLCKITRPVRLRPRLGIGQ